MKLELPILVRTPVTRLVALLVTVATAMLCSTADARPLGQQGAPLPSPPEPQAEEAPLPSPPAPAVTFPPAELDRIVSPIALYPDPLLGQLLTAATFAPEIPEAARWSDRHHYVQPEALPAAIAADRLPWQPSVQALLPFPSVLDMMASDMPWTEELGSAFLAEPQQVMDAVQRMRQLSWRYGYLRSNAQVIVRSGPYIEIVPVNPGYVVVPYYSPAVVFAPPRPGFIVATGVRFGFGVTVGAAFAPWGWGSTRFAWGDHALFVNNVVWQRTWVNRAVYVHPYAVPRYAVPRGDMRHDAVERHEVIERSPREREAARDGRERREEHRRDHER